MNLLSGFVCLTIIAVVAAGNEDELKCINH